MRTRSGARQAGIGKTNVMFFRKIIDKKIKNKKLKCKIVEILHFVQNDRIKKIKN